MLYPARLLGARHKAFLLAFLATLLAASASLPSSAANAQSGTGTTSTQGTVPFLTLPFEPQAGMNILSGWYYSGSSGLNNGLDYINGSTSSPRTWRTFPVLAAADGEACGNCSGRQGNAVWVRHKVGGATFYTYYGHLSSFAPDIPIGSQSRVVKVKRGQLLGMAGNTGAGQGILHLHFALYNSGSKPLDPYSIGKQRQFYPSPQAGQPGVGWFLGERAVGGAEPDMAALGDVPTASLSEARKVYGLRPTR